jgi:hypothetical protein
MLLRRDENTEESLEELQDTGRMLLQTLRVFHSVTGPLSLVRHITSADDT